MGHVELTQEIVDGAPTTFAEVEQLEQELRNIDRLESIVPLLVTVARRALGAQDWEAGRHWDLAMLLKRHSLFSYARRLLGRLTEPPPGVRYDELCQQRALCTYKDRELPTAARLKRAFEELEGAGTVTNSTDPETFGIAGAIYKRKWEAGADRADLDRALRYYLAGSKLPSNEGTELPKNDGYAAINAAFILDQLAALEIAEFEKLTDEATRLRGEADTIREGLLTTAFGAWKHATVGEALFGLRRFGPAREQLEKVADATPELWKLESTAMQLGALARLREFDTPEAHEALAALLRGHGGAVRRASTGKVGLALSGGGYRASLFHIGVLARLAECRVLRRVEVLSCVSGGSIVGAYYYLKLRELLQSTADDEVTDEHYVKLVHEVAEHVLEAVQQNLRGRLTANVKANWRMAASSYSRTDRAAELFAELFYSKLPTQPGSQLPATWHMRDLHVRPKGRGDAFSLRYENWLREAKVPVLVLNATTLNTGHSWQFTASWMGEPPSASHEQLDASPRLRRVYYDDAPEGEHRDPPLAKAVAASACVPMLFAPVTFSGLYDDVDVELVDGGVHDNQGVASVLEQDCDVVLMSDASGQIRADDHPRRGTIAVANRSKSILSSRVRATQIADLVARYNSKALRGLMVVHLTKRLPSQPRNWIGCQDPYNEDDDVFAPPPGAPTYGLDEAVQLALSQLRTDLDTFSDDEAYTLMAAGYAMTRLELCRALPELKDAIPALEQAEKWPFQDALDTLASPPAPLAGDLRRGATLFFRRLRDPDAKGVLRPLLDKTGLSAASRGASTVLRRGVVSAARKVVGAPLALLGALGTQIKLRLAGPADGED